MGTANDDRDARPERARSVRLGRRELLEMSAAATAAGGLGSLSLSASAAPRSGRSIAAQNSGEEPWFGINLPPSFEPHVPQVTLGDRGPGPAIVPHGEQAYRELEGEAIRRDLETIISFSKESRETRELGGSGQLWGRVAGFPSLTRTVEWAVEQFQDAGISDVYIQEFDQSASASFYVPVEWEVRLIGDQVFGAGSADVVLESAQPLTGTEIPGGSLTAPLVYVGTGRPAELDQVDVSGKVAVQYVKPQAHVFFERAATVGAAEDLINRGAVAVLNVIDYPGNMRVRDFTFDPAFNIGGQDGRFLLSVMDEATRAGTLDDLQVRLSLESTSRSGLSAENGVAIIRGKGKPDEYIVINAHADGWFDGANDNGDGMAVMIALARHFAQPRHKPERSMVFVASAGHHTSGLSGPSNFVNAHPEIMENAVLAVNIEHVAVRNFGLERDTFEDGHRKWVADSGEAPIVVGVHNDSPFVNDLFDKGVERYGANFVSQPTDVQTGEAGAYRNALGRGTSVHVIQAPVHYHTSGEVLEVISTPGLERIARFFASFLKDIDAASLNQIAP